MLIIIMLNFIYYNQIYLFKTVILVIHKYSSLINVSL